MGVIADLLEIAKTFTNTDDRAGTLRSVHQNLVDLQTEIGDFDYDGDSAPENAHHVIHPHDGDVDSGTFTLTFNLNGGVTFTTDPIEFDATAEDIQSAVDTAADGVVPGYAPGDIAVSGGPLTDESVHLYFSGPSVAGRYHDETEIDGDMEDDMSESVSPGNVDQASDGKVGQPAWALLKALGIYTGSVPDPDEDITVSGSDVPVKRGQFPNSLNFETIRAVVTEASGSSVQTRDSFMRALGY